MDIVEELRRDRENGAKRLVEEYKTGLMTLARRFCRNPSDAEELVNRTFAAVIEGIDGFLEQSSFFTWMCQILVNLNANDNRRKANGEIVYPGELPEVADESADDGVYKALDAALLRDAIRTLPEDIRKTVVLHYFMEMSVKDIARFLAIPTGTVMWRLHYARKMLAVKMGAAAKKPGGKAVILALLLCGLTALGAGARLAVVRLLSPSVAVEQQADNSKDAGQAETYDLQFSTSSNLPQSPSGVAGSPQRGAEGGADFSPGETMNITKTTTRTAAMLAAATVATGATLSTSASTVTISVPVVTDYTLDQAFANGCVSGAADVSELCAADDLLIDGVGRLIIDQDLKTAGFAGEIHVNAGATLRVTVNGALGDTSHGTFVADGATFETLAASGVTFDFRGEPLSFAGAGVDGMGALKALSTTLQYNGAWGGTDLTMAGDAKVFSDSDQNQVFLLRDSNATLNMNGHTLTIAGRNQNAGLTFRAVISNPGDIVTTNVHLMVRRQAVFPGGASHTLRLEAGSRMQLYECGAGTRANRTWKILVPPSGTATPINIDRSAAVWNGPVEFQRAATVAAPYSCEFGGSMTASALVTFEGYEPYGRQTITLSASTNDLRGGVVATAADVQLGASGAADARFYAGLNYGTRTDLTKWTDAFYEANGTAPVTNKVVLDFSDLADGQTAPSSGLSTYYTGYIWNPSSSSVVWRFASYSSRRAGMKFDDYAAFPNNYVVQQDKDDIKFGNVTLKPGANKFAFRLSTSSTLTRLFTVAPSSSPSWPTTLPVAYCTTSTTSTDPADFSPLADPGDGSVLRIAEEGTDYWDELAAAAQKAQAWASLAVADGETINVGQIPLTVGNLSGFPAIASTYVNTKADAFTVTGTWSVLADDVLKGDKIDSDVAIVFGMGATLEIVGVKGLDEGEYVIAQSDVSVTGVPALDATSARYATLSIAANGKSLVLKVRKPATTILIR